MENNVFDTALCFEGGGYRASYTAGFANVLLENQIYFDFVCGISAGASHAVDYVSRDEKRVRDAFIILTTKRPEAGGVRSLLMGNGYFNGDYVYVGCAVDGYMPFDWASFSQNPARVTIQGYDVDAGRTVVWDRESMPALVPMMGHVRASSTLPGMMLPITVDGHLCYDGGLGEGAGLPTHLALDAGFERLVVVATRPEGYRKEPPGEATRALYRRLSRGNEHLYQALVTRNERYNAALDELGALERSGRAWVFRPDHMEVRSTTLDRPKLERSYRLGHEQAARELDRFREWLGA